MSVFVLVHGSWGGGWQWRQVANDLRSRGHEVFTPTLAGLGDRAHLVAAPADLSLHIQDVVRLLYFEDLRDAVLVGWSYGGLVVDGVADLVPERVRHVVNLDGVVACEGRSLMDEWTDQAPSPMSAMLDQGRATGWIPAPTADDLADVIDDPDLRAWLGERERPHPLATYAEPYPDTGGRRFSVRHTFIRLTDDDWPEVATVTALRSDERWAFREIPLNHLGLMNAPSVVAEALHDLAP